MNPFESPVRFVCDTRDVGYGLEEKFFLVFILAEGVDQNRVRLTVDVLHHHLKAVKTPSLRNLDLGTKSLGEIFENYPIASCKKRKHMLDKMLFIFVEFRPVS